MSRLNDKVAIITGSDSAIGKEIARSYAKEGAKVVIADFNDESLRETVAEFQKEGLDAFGVQVNVASEDDIQRMVDDTIAHYGKVDILVNNAGIGDEMQAAGNVQDDTWNRVIDINLTGVMRAMRKVIPHFIEQGGGTIVNMASISALTGGLGGLAYTAVKHAVVGMTKNVASQYGPHHIRCNAIAPAQIATKFAANMSKMDQFGLEVATRGVSMMPRVGTVEEVANIAIFLASDESSLINGVAIAADSGWSAY